MQFLTAFFFCFFAGLSQATEIVREQGFEIQVQPFPSTFLTPEIAKIYGLERSRRQSLLNVVVLQVHTDGSARGAVSASVKGFVKNLIGQTQELSFQEIDEGEGAIYYLAPIRVSNEETIQVSLKVTLEGSPEIDVNFRHKVYVD
ncbi:DUF4426 domain-containing protein [Litorivicinus sp.]|nr:DUF4426 domain-containing protein [Litorivicinus sp.]MDC1208931.1 DUF4426 domain-containing protein [Litorivicinus sp.]MDC1240432.1 DUF4426 domain-containing protein [Litorivicinus sp.]